MSLPPRRGWRTPLCACVALAPGGAWNRHVAFATLIVASLVTDPDPVPSARLLPLLAALLATSAASSFALPAPAPLKIAYRVAMPDPSSHLYEVEIDVDGVRAATLPMQLPVWSTGRYARVDFAKNVQDLKIATPDGRVLTWDKTNGSRWIVNTAGAKGVRIRYRVFANSLSGTYSVLDTAHANWNGAGLFMYVEDHKQDPVSLAITPPPVGA